VIVPLLLAAAFVADADPAALQPSGRWQVDYQVDKCLLSRAFGPATASVGFGIKPAIVFGSGRASLYIVVPDSRDGAVHRGEAKITLQPSGRVFRELYVSSRPKDGAIRGYEIAGDRDLMATLGDSSELTVNAGPIKYTFETGKMANVFTALDTCNANLLKSWGVDPDARAEILNDANPARWFTFRDYPPGARSRGEQGRVTVVLTVGADGRPTACRVTVSSVHPELDKATCDIAMQRGRYVPQTGKADRFSVLALDWRMDGW
jgi:TonB family protein